MKDHLDRIREFEQRAFALPQKNGPAPPCPRAPPSPTVALRIPG